MARILVGTEDGLFEVGEGRTQFPGRQVTALEAGGRWVILDGTEVWRSSAAGSWEQAATLSGFEGTCLVAADGAVLVGTIGAHLLRLEGGRLEPVRSFDEAEGRDKWYTPWGDPADTRSLARDDAGALFANVHVGGILRSAGGGASWEPTVIDIDSDVHQVIAWPGRARWVLAATAVGLARSEDGGASWRFDTEGLHATYLRAVAVAGETVLVSASTGPSGRRSAVYRCVAGESGPFERCREGLPEWFSDNIDSYCLDAAGSAVAFGTSDGRVFLSTDEGRSWEEAAAGLPPVGCLVVGEG